MAGTPTVGTVHSGSVTANGSSVPSPDEGWSKSGKLRSQE